MKINSPSVKKSSISFLRVKISFHSDAKTLDRLACMYMVFSVDLQQVRRCIPAGEVYFHGFDVFHLKFAAG